MYIFWLFSDLPDNPDHLLLYARFQLDPSHSRIFPSKETSSLALVNTGNIDKSSAKSGFLTRKYIILKIVD